jgi:hypothetical protein
VPTLRFVIVLLLGCFGSVSLSCHHTCPPATTPQQRFVSDKIPRPHQFSAQMYYVDSLRTKYTEQLQKRKVDLTKVETRVYWSRTTCPNGRVGLFHKNPDDKEAGCYAGLTWSCKEMYVADYDIPLSETAFIHELGHCYYRGIYGKRDTDHGDKDFWKHVDKVDKDLGKRGW